MPKLPQEFQFVDLSDYGRWAARQIAMVLKETSITPIHVTSWFIITGLLAIICMLYDYYIAAALFLILKSILDAADGELSRLKDTPSYTGRYYDSIADFVLNFLFLLTFWHITNGSIVYLILAFLGMQLQGSVYNYYYVILRNRVDGDMTSRVFENVAPKAMEGESQQSVNILYHIYNVLYITFDKLIYALDKAAINSKPFPKWFMTSLSIYGLGFQLLLMAVMLLLHLEEYVIPFFMLYTVFVLFFVGIRRWVLR